MNALFWLPAICVGLHITEEFFWPGGFSAWFRGYRPENESSFTPHFAFWMNALLVAATIVIGTIGPTWSRGVSLWLTVVAILGGNALLHLRGTWRTRSYSPGAVTGTLLYLPLCIGGYWHFIANGMATLQMAMVTFIVGASYDFWSMMNHRRRAAVMSAKA